MLPQQYGFCNGSIYIIFDSRPLDILYQHLKIKIATLQNNSNDKAASEHIHKQWLGMLYNKKQSSYNSKMYTFIGLWLHFYLMSTYKN